MNKTAQQSLLDILIQIMPSLQDAKNKIINKNDSSNKNLYDMWSGTSKCANRKILKPMNLSSSDVKKMVSSGLIEEQGNYIKITEKGEQAIKVMVLNDDSFALSESFSKKSSSENNLFKKASVSKENKGWYSKLKNDNLY